MFSEHDQTSEAPTPKIKEFTSKEEAKEYIQSMPIEKRKLTRPQIREEFTYKPTPRSRIVLRSEGAYTLRTDGTFQKGEPTPERD